MIGLSFLITVGPWSTQGPQLGAEPFSDPSDGRLAGFDQRLGAVPADVEPQEVQAVAEGDDVRLILVEGQAPDASQLASRALTSSACCLEWQERDEIIGVPDQHRGVRSHPTFGS